MQQLSGMDYMFFGLETDDNPSHIAGISLCDRASTVGGKLARARILKLLRERLTPLPLVRRRLQRVPWNLDYPYWVEDEAFDIDAHLRTLRLPEPGSRAQLNEMLARLVNEPFAEDRPLWEICVIEGINSDPELSEGSFALCLRMHHVFADAATSMVITDAMYDNSELNPAEFGEIQAQPDKLQMLAAALSNSVRHSFLAGLKTLQAVPPVSQYLSATIGEAIRNRSLHLRRLQDPKTQLVPQTRDPARNTDACRLSLKNLNAMRQLVDGCTINDLLVAVIGGGIRRYLELRGETPGDSLTAVVPINLRQFDSGEQGSNVVSAMMLPLGQHIEEPIERLDTIRRASIRTKRDDVMGLNRRFADIANGLPAPVLATALSAIRRTLYGTGLSFASTIVSNVRSYTEPRTFGGAEITHNYGIGLLGPGIGSLHACTVYAGYLHIGLTCSPAAIPDTREYMHCIELSYSEYENLVCKTPVSRATG